jgi:lysyl-tRNA synthetase class 2
MLGAMDSHFRRELIRHARFERTIRSFFDDRGYVEVSTPLLAPFLIPEPAIEVFRTEYLPGSGLPRPLWLTPSPELWMKRLLARGSGDIYQVSRSFRNGDFGGPHHNPEFRLLEWYSMNSGYLESIAVTEALFGQLIADEDESRRRLASPFHRMTMAEAFRTYARIELSECMEVDAIVEAGLRQGVRIQSGSTWEEAFHIVFLSLVEPLLPRDKPLMLLDYPSRVPTTARRKPGTPWAERWELFVDGVEIANCYTEETDPEALEKLITSETERKAGARVPHAADTGLARVFPRGFPTCTGTALGVDRLEMVLAGEKTLEGVILFPFSDILGAKSGTEGRKESDDQGE